MELYKLSCYCEEYQGQSAEHWRYTETETSECY